jgi:hypothetical protein
LAASDTARTKLLNAEITQSAPQPFAAGQVSFTFQLTAPATNELLTLYGNGLSTNGDGTTAGDSDNRTTLDITVTGGVDGGPPPPLSAADAGSGGALQVNLLYPTQGASLAGVTPLQATALSPSGISDVTFFLNNLPIGSVATPAYTLQFTTGAWPDGTYSVAAAATDTTGATVVSAPVSVSIFNGSSAASCSASPHGAPISWISSALLALWVLNRSGRVQHRLRRHGAMKQNPLNSQPRLSCFVLEKSKPRSG